jgi:hypothetical protein
MRQVGRSFLVLKIRQFPCLQKNSTLLRNGRNKKKHLVTESTLKGFTLCSVSNHFFIRRSVFLFVSIIYQN